MIYFLVVYYSEAYHVLKETIFRKNLIFKVDENINTVVFTVG